jgi:spermidine synthase
VADTLLVRQSTARGLYSPATLLLGGVWFIFSGATGLIYEVLWARILGLVFGATTLAVSTVLAAFMGGLALGSALAARFATRIRRPLRAYGLMEAGIAVYALLVPSLFRLIDALYVQIWQHFHPGFFAFSVWRFVLSSLILLVPTTLMGATLPVLSAALTRTAGRTSTSVTRLYACNLVGAIAGTLAAGFVLLPSIGVRATIVVAAIINVLVAFTAVLLERKSDLTAQVEPEVADSTAERSNQVNAKGFWLFTAFISGFVTISTQVAWTRILTMIIGSSTYAFSIVVALFLIGLSVGAWLVARSKFAQALRAAVLKVEVITVATLLISLVVLNWIPALLINLGMKFQVGSWLGLLSLQILSATLLVLLPAILMGMVMPLVLVWASTGNESVALVGRSYAVNTVGAIVGAFVTGFVLIPRTGTKFTLLCSAALCLIVAGVAYQPRHDARDPAVRKSVGYGLTLAAVCLIFVLAPPMNLADLSVGAYDTLIRILARSREGLQQDKSEAGGDNTHKLLMYREGPTSTVSVRNDQNTISMAINGRTNASDSEFDMPTQVMLAQIPVVVAPRLGKGLIIGFATGVSVGAMLQSPIESVTCVELEPATIDGSRFFEHVNNRPLSDSRVRLVIDDARTYLRVTPERYDIIVSEPSHPWVAGVANLFTHEFFEMGRSKLSDEGVFVQWVQIYQLSTDSLKSVLATYQSVFPHVLVFRVLGASKGKDLILMGSNQPLDLSRIPQRLNDPRTVAELGRVNLRSESDVKDWFVCDETRLGPAVAGAIINTDDNMHIETTVPREAFKPLMQTNAQWIEALREH